MKQGFARNDKKLFGGFNFLVVLWILLSIFRLSVLLNKQELTELLTFDFITFLIPLLFLTILNVMIGISLFFPQRGRPMWVLSLIVVMVSLVALNTLQDKITAHDYSRKTAENIMMF